MPYRKRKKATSGFIKYCKPKLAAIKNARSAGSRSRTAKAYQQCLLKNDIDTGLGKASRLNKKKTKK